MLLNFYSRIWETSIFFGPTGENGLKSPKMQIQNFASNTMVGSHILNQILYWTIKWILVVFSESAIFAEIGWVYAFTAGYGASWSQGGSGALMHSPKTPYWLLMLQTVELICIFFCSNWLIWGRKELDRFKKPWRLFPITEMLTKKVESWS